MKKKGAKKTDFKIIHIYVKGQEGFLNKLNLFRIERKKFWK